MTLTGTVKLQLWMRGRLTSKLLVGLLIDSALNGNSNHRIGIFDSESARPRKPTEVSPWRDKGKSKERERESGERGAMTRRSLAVDNLV